MSIISILGCGWLGLPLAEKLLQEGHQVKGSTTRAERIAELRSRGVEPFQLCAVNGTWEGEGLTEFLACDVLIVAIPPGTKRNPDSAHAEEIYALLELISELHSTIDKIIYISSTSVYKNENRIVVESDIAEERDAANKILFRAEQYVQSSVIKEKLILRLGGLTGYERMLARFFAGKAELAGGNEPVNLVHRDDVVSVILFLLKKKTGDTVLNVCSPLHPTRKEFYMQLCERFQLAAPDFSEKKHADWKEVSTDKLDSLGYSWIYPDPYTYSYTYQ